MSIPLIIDTPGGADFQGYHLRNVATAHVGGSALADATLQVTGSLHVTGAVTFDSGATVAATQTPSVNDGAALGTGTLSWSDLFLANGGVINWNNGNYTITHSAGLLTLSGALTVTGAVILNSSLTVNGVTSLVGNVDVTGDLDVSGTLTTAGITTTGTLDVTGAFSVTGASTMRGIAAETDSTYDIGTTSVRFRVIYADTIDGTTLTGTITSGQVSDFSEAVDDRVAVLIQDAASGGLTWTYSDVGGTLTPTLAIVNADVDAAAAIVASKIAAGTFGAGTYSFSGSTITTLGTVTSLGTVNGGTINAGLTWSAAQNLGSVALTNVNIDSGDISAATISGSLTWSAAQNFATGTTTIATVDINGGTLDGVAIGGAVAAAANVTTLDASVRVDVNSVQGVDVNPGSDVDADLITVGVDGTPRIWWDESDNRFTLTHGLDIDAGALNASGGGALTGTWSDLGTVTTVDINGGSIDGTVIGAASAAAITGTTLTATGGDITLGAATSQILLSGQGNVNTIFDIDFPQLTTANPTIRIFRDTATSGTALFTIYDPGTTTPAFQVDAQTGNVTLGGVAGMDVNPGSDVDVDIFTVGVTGTPRLWWDESDDRFRLTLGLQINTGGIILGGAFGMDVNPGSDADADLITVGVTGTPRIWWDESDDRFTLTHGLDIGGIVRVNDTTDATSTTTGSLQTDGGAGIVKKLYVGDDVNIAGDLVVSGVGPHAIGETALGYRQVHIGGSFTSDGSSTILEGFVYRPTLTAANGDTAGHRGAIFNATMNTQSNSETVGLVTQVQIDEPSITKGTDTITLAATLYILNAPTEGTTNSAIHVAEGVTRLADSTASTSTTTGALVVTGGVGIGGALWTGGRQVQAAAGVAYIGEAAASGNFTHASATTALIINQEGADNIILALKSSDVATGLTTAALQQDVETDDFFTITKSGAGTVGGTAFQILGESTHATPGLWEVYGGAPATTDVTSSFGAMNFYVAQHDGANALQDMAADSNAFAWGEITSGGSRLTRMLLKADDGELHLGNTTLVALDDEDDISLVRALQVHRTNGLGIIHEDWEDPVYSYDKLREIGVVGAKDAQGDFLIRVQPYLSLHDGAIWQLHKNQVELGDIVMSHESRLEALDEKVLGLEGRMALLEA